jgi:hypothetical protein
VQLFSHTWPRPLATVVVHVFHATASTPTPSSAHATTISVGSTCACRACGGGAVQSEMTFGTAAPAVDGGGAVVLTGGATVVGGVCGVVVLTRGRVSVGECRPDAGEPAPQPAASNADTTMPVAATTCFCTPALSHPSGR